MQGCFIMRKILCSLLLVLISNCYANEPEYIICFTPGGDCTGLLVRKIQQAKQNILVQAYSFTSVPIASALIDADRRGVDVKIILDKSQLKARNGAYSSFLDNHIALWIDYKVSIAHNKVMIIDGKTVVTGSFNFVRRESRVVDCSGCNSSEPTVPSVVL